jgi:hypothetical protein
MSQISPPIRILLVCAVAFLAAWMLFLRPSTDAVTPAAEAPATVATPDATRPVDAGGEQAESLAGKAVEAANDTTAAADRRVERMENGTETAADAGSAANATTSGATANAAGAPAGAAADPGAKAEDAAAAGLPKRVARALDRQKVIALLFWSPKASEDRAVRKALSGIDRHDGKVLAHATHINRIAAYQQITRGANVEQSPTVVVIDPARNVQTLVGYVDRVTIDQAVTDALRTKRRG